jgi:hypothetical protein
MGTKVKLDIIIFGATGRSTVFFIKQEGTTVQAVKERSYVD